MKKRGLIFIVSLLVLSSFVCAGTLKVTSEHPFLINGEWIPASELKIGDRLTEINGKIVEITSIKKVVPKEPFLVYNIEAGIYNNFVVRDNDNLSIVVHNSNSQDIKALEEYLMLVYNFDRPAYSFAGKLYKSLTNLIDRNPGLAARYNLERNLFSDPIKGKSLTTNFQNVLKSKDHISLHYIGIEEGVVKYAPKVSETVSVFKNLALSRKTYTDLITVDEITGVVNNIIRTGEVPAGVSNIRFFDLSGIKAIKQAGGTKGIVLEKVISFRYKGIRHEFFIKSNAQGKIEISTGYPSEGKGVLFHTEKSLEELILQREKVESTR